VSNHQAAVDMIKNACKNFNGFGIMEDGRKCKAGLVIRSMVGGGIDGWTKRAPCIASNQTDIVCTKQCF